MATTIYDVLKREHAELSALVHELHDSDEAESKRRTAVLAQLVEYVAAHSRAEQEVVYPLLRRTPDGDVRMKQALADHGDIEVALRDLVACDVHDELWIAKVEVLHAALDVHVDREEHEIFASLRALLDDARAQRLGEAFGHRKAMLAGHAA
jgi:hemerythrin-like domain-containing protein